MSNAPAKSPGLQLFLVSFLVLFVELVLIRWIPSTFHVVAFFNNLVLIGCFLGMGMGMLRPTTTAQVAWQVLFRLSAACVLFTALSTNIFTVEIPTSGDYGINELKLSNGLFGSVPLPVVLLAIFAVVVWVMYPLGQWMALTFDALPKLRAYSINIAGSLLGVLGFACLSWFGLPPLVWFSIAIVVVAFTHFEKLFVVPAVVILGCVFGQAFFTSNQFTREVHWSPYYKVIVDTVDRDNPKAGIMLQVNDQFLLSGFDLRDEAKLNESKLARSMMPSYDQLPPEGKAKADTEAGKFTKEVESLKTYYRFPFQLRQAKRVLILGSGAGNDVATALRNGVEQVTAVEIDPKVLELGQKYHPESPYASPKVKIVNNDARAYLNRTDDRYDLIIFATLDAHGLISTVGNVRLDSFIYTQQSIEAAKRLLTPEGIMCLSFGPFREETQYRQYATVKSVFGQEPGYFMHTNDHRTIVAGNLSGIKADPLPTHWRRINAEEIATKMKQYPYAVIPATDDWPHLYIREPKVPTEYWGVLGGVLLITLLLVGWEMKSKPRFEMEFFFLGAGFLLMETKSVTEFALLFGSTWQVNVLVFCIILVVILLANALVPFIQGKIPPALIYLLLLASLFASWLYPPTQWATGLSVMGMYFGAGLYLGLPIFFAAILFASALQRTAVGSIALACNILGSVLGGTSEYLSMAYGLRFLCLLALGMYGLAFLGHLMSKKPTSSHGA
jgi:spermidine synthase